FLEECPSLLGLANQQLVEVDAEVRQVIQKWPQPEEAVLQVIALANLQEPAEGAEQAEALLHGVAGNGVENDVDTGADRGVPHFVHEGQRTTIKHMPHADSLQVVALLRTAGGSENFATKMFHDLDCRQADAPRGAVNQYALARLHAC